MLKLPGNASQFLASYWQKEPLFAPAALTRIRPAITRNELGWLATLEDVESRLVYTDHDGDHVRYRAETGPFDNEYLASLPKRDWTLLVHDVEKHLPPMRRLFTHVPFIPDWRIDDLMVSFAAPGGSVGPHRDHYDVFLCQGIGVREWHVSIDDVADDVTASDELALIAPFTGSTHVAHEGDVLYLPPGAAHWGTATRACITYSIGMRAPQLSDLLPGLPDEEGDTAFYCDPDLRLDESVPGYISPRSTHRLQRLTGRRGLSPQQTGAALGCFVTQPKDWITPDGASDAEVLALLEHPGRGPNLSIHGMARIAWDDCNVYVNGASRARGEIGSAWLESLCAKRKLSLAPKIDAQHVDCLVWMLKMGTFEIPETL